MDAWTVVIILYALVALAMAYYEGTPE